MKKNLIMKIFVFSALFLLFVSLVTGCRKSKDEINSYPGIGELFMQPPWKLAENNTAVKTNGFLYRKETNLSSSEKRLLATFQWTWMDNSESFDPSYLPPVIIICKRKKRH